MKTVARSTLLVGCLMFAGATLALAQGNPPRPNPPGLAQVVALDECDPVTFNAALGSDFCRNVTLGAFATLSDLFAKAAAGTPDPGWDFEPDTVHIKKGTHFKRSRPGRRASHLHRGGAVRWRLHTGAQCAGRGHGSRMCRRLFESRGGQNSNPSRQRFKHHGSVERGTSFSVLYPSVDAHESRSEITGGRREKRARAGC